MRRLSLTVLLFFFRMLAAWSQETAPEPAAADSAYKGRKLRLDEVNLVTSYYRQDGDNSAVTGGTGTEALTDNPYLMDLKWIRSDRKARQHSLLVELGMDHYTSASSDKIDPATVSSASSADTRYYPSLAWTVKDDRKKWTAGISAAYSTEYDYKSWGLGLNAARASKDNNRELALKLQAYWDTWTVILPIELRTGGGRREDEGTQPRNSYSASLTYSQVVNKRLQLAFLLDLISQQGLLATKYQRVYFTDGGVAAEELPGNRLKLAAGLRTAWFLTDRLVLRGFYRYYGDDWGVRAHTLSLELPVKINPFLSVSPFYRYYVQTGADYFAPYREHRPADLYYTSDYDLSAFSSHFVGAGVRYSPEKGVLGLRRWTLLEVRYGHYTRSNGLQSDIITVLARFRKASG